MSSEGGKGTPPFMAPEIWEGKKLQAPADVYAFAMMCFEVTNEGEYPWRRGMIPDMVGRKERAWRACFVGFSQICIQIPHIVLSNKRPQRPDLASDTMWSLMQLA